jgi:hypothetical protein
VIVVSVGPYPFIHRTRRSTCRRHHSSFSGITRSLPATTSLTLPGTVLPVLDISPTHSCQNPAGRFNTVTPSLSTCLSSSATPIASSPLITTVPPLAHVGYISSAATSNVTDANCSTRSFPVSS